jgi:hypothetical protein
MERGEMMQPVISACVMQKSGLRCFHFSRNKSIPAFVGGSFICRGIPEIVPYFTLALLGFLQLQPERPQNRDARLVGWSRLLGW